MFVGGCFLCGFFFLGGGGGRLIRSIQFLLIDLSYPHSNCILLKERIGIDELGNSSEISMWLIGRNIAPLFRTVVKVVDQECFLNSIVCGWLVSSKSSQKARAFMLKILDVSFSRLTAQTHVECVHFVQLNRPWSGFKIA